MVLSCVRSPIHEVLVGFSCCRCMLLWYLSCSHQRRQTMLVRLFEINRLSLVMFCALNERFCFWSFCNESTFEAWIPLRFPGKKHTRQEMVLYRFLLNKRMCRYQIIVFISVLCVSKLTIIDMFHLSLLTNRLIFFKKDVEIATWLILPVAYACLKD